MQKNRLEAFSDGVLAIIITIMVLELKVPHGVTWQTLLPLLPVFFSYVLSFVYVGIYWNNHHHLLHATHKVSGRVMWANLHLLFWLSLLPFVTGWMGENHFDALPTALYGVVLALSAMAYWVLTRTIIATDGPESTLAKAVGKDHKGVGSLLVYLLAIPVAYFHPHVSQLLYLLMALIWLVPDRRIEQALAAHPNGPHGDAQPH